MVDGNIRPVFLLLKYAGHAMVRAGGGSFVAVSSTAAEFAARYFAPYAAGRPRSINSYGLPPTSSVRWTSG